MAEDIERGSAWQQEIESQLYKSDWFLLIFSGVDEDDWSWCHHEAGLFCDGYPTSIGSSSCIRRTSTCLARCRNIRPSNARWRDGKSEDVDRFFEDLFGAEPYPGFSRSTPSSPTRRTARQEAAAKIIQAVGRLVVEDRAGGGGPCAERRSAADLDRLPGRHPHQAGVRARCACSSSANTGTPVARLSQDRLEPALQERPAQSLWPAIYQACAKSVTNKLLCLDPRRCCDRRRTGRHYMPSISRDRLHR